MSSRPLQHLSDEESLDLLIQQKEECLAMLEPLAATNIDHLLDDLRRDCPLVIILSSIEPRSDRVAYVLTAMQGTKTIFFVTGATPKGAIGKFRESYKTAVFGRALRATS